MKSPFPGMDPYLEQYWGDVHASMTTYTRDLLRPQMPPDLVVRIEEFVSVVADTPNGHGELYKPDARVVEPKKGGRGPRRVTPALTASESVMVTVRTEPETLRTVRVLDTKDGGRVVTALEFLSYSNKEMPGLAAYRAKRRDYLRGGASVVEIDLLREGRHAIYAPRRGLPPDYRRPYRVCVVRAWDRGRAELYKATFTERLPVVRVPLRRDDKDALLDLQAVIGQCYENGGYARIDYADDPEPPFGPRDEAWADLWLRERGRRK